MAKVFSANSSNIRLDGKPIEGLQSLTYRVVTEREDIRAIGTNERIDVSFGLRSVQGEIVVKSISSELDDYHHQLTKFQLVVNLKKDLSADGPKRVLSFDDCFLENKAMGMDAGGTALTTYGFTATRLREE
jgi:hypothetical protein